MNDSPHGVLAFAWALPILFISLFIFPYFTAGDQEFYRSFYNGVSELSFAEGFAFYKDSLGTSEPGYFLLSFLLSPFVPKDILFSVLNFVLFQQLFLWLLRNDVSRVLFPMLYLNFYLLVLAFSAERLKLSLLFFLIGFCASSLLRYLFLAASVISHVQVLILIASTQVRRLNAVLGALFQGRVGYGFLSLAFLTMLMLAILFVLRDHIASKLGAYYGVWGGPEAVLKPLLFTLLSVFYAQERKFEALLASLPLALCAYLIGEERIVIFSYFIFMFYALQVNRGLNVGVAITSLYFSYKGILFLSNVMFLGDGFARAS
ncbi:hypothetical protein [Pseudomonas deceptionensis]|uniref:EpsG family protein n=1 Tax=Pseudomonas deceptionensis TaxID=882211 RepID=A0A0J6GH74_PSEDM|nr:hypothetical protein [Pseudomonas deceptionensis]KMM81060.1 hypothetical protein TR67_02970 [Pseudomonas deceptionensis]SEE85126.1 hypothetical protein SAMN04489800_2445 [Pseudomonas deceptionensis]